MIDSFIRPYINPPLSWLARKLVEAGVRADHVTWGGFGLGCIGFVMLVFGLYELALVSLVLNRLSDGLDGPVARIWQEKEAEKGTTDYGGYLDIVLDMIYYAGFVFFFALGKPETFPYAAFLIFSFMGTSSSFLAYAIIAAKRGEDTQKRGFKSFYHAGGLIEGTETIIFLGLMCLFPQHFIILSMIFAMLCWVTVAGRIYMARQAYGDHVSALHQEKDKQKAASDQAACNQQD